MLPAALVQGISILGDRPIVNLPFGETPIAPITGPVVSHVAYVL
jgi:hypothetical protein